MGRLPWQQGKWSQPYIVSRELAGRRSDQAMSGILCEGREGELPTVRKWIAAGM